MFFISWSLKMYRLRLCRKSRLDPLYDGLRRPSNGDFREAWTALEGRPTGFPKKPRVSYEITRFRKRQNVSLRILGCLACLLLWVPNAKLHAQQKPSPAVAGNAAAEFNHLLGDLKGVVAELGILKTEYRRADEQRRAEIEKQWKELIAKGDALQPQLIDAAQKAFAEAPNAEKQVTDLLVDLLAGYDRTDNYEKALPLGKLLAENDCDDLRAYNLAGVAAFAMSDFDAAEKYFKRATRNHLRIGTGNENVDGFIGDFVRNPQKYKQAWEKEKKVRAAEDKAGDLPVVLLKTNKGDIKLLLLENEAPNTVANFISLVEKGYYDGLTFHRVLPGFMAQGGCPEGTGAGGPGYNIPCECYRPDHRTHARGSLSMAHAGRDTGGSQFFLTFLPTSHLDGRHTVFGRVIEGFDVLHKLQRRDPQKSNPPEPDIILKAQVLGKRDHPYVPKKTGDEFNE